MFNSIIRLRLVIVPRVFNSIYIIKAEASLCPTAVQSLLDIRYIRMGDDNDLLSVYCHRGETC